MLVCLANAARAGDAPECALSLDVSPVAETGGLAVAFSAPCNPYALVALSYGAVRFVEETGRDGSLRLSVPALPGQAYLAAVTATQSVTVSLPPIAASESALVLSWEDANAAPTFAGDGSLNTQLGFPGGSPQALVRKLDGSSTVTVDLPVTSASCGQSLVLQLSWLPIAEQDALNVLMPPCARVGERLRLTLPVPGSG